MRIKILHIIFSFTPNGAETMLANIINEQAQVASVELIIINNLYNRALVQTINKTIKVFYLNRIPGSINPLKIIFLNFKIYKIKPDIIHFHDHNAIGLVKYTGNAKTFLTVHGLRRPLRFLPKYDKLIAISKAVQRDLEVRGSFNSIMIYNGIDFSKIKIRKESFDDKTFKIVEVSRLYHEIKGQDILLKALQNLIYKNEITNVQLDFIGDGPSFPYLQKLTQDLGLKGYVNFLGLKDRNFIYNTLKSYSLLVQPSIHEGFGLTIIEGIAAQIPVLVSNIPGPMEVIGYGKYGFYFESKNPISCAEEVKKILLKKHESIFYSKLKYSYDYALHNYSIQRTASEYIKEYYFIKKVL